MGLAQRLLATSDPVAARRLLAGTPPEVLPEALEEIAGEVLRLLREHPQRATEVAAHAELIAQTTGAPLHRARARWVRGHALAAVLRTDEALSCYEAAARAYQQLGMPLEAARTAIGRVNALMYLGRYEEALAIGERARNVFVRHGQHTAAARLDMNLGNIFHRLEQPSRALRIYDRALRVARRLRDRKMAQHIQANRANILTTLGRLDRAERLYRVAQESAREDGETWFVAHIDNMLGYLYVQRGDYGHAFEALDGARTTFEALDDRQSQLVVLLDLTELLLEVVGFERAKSLGRRARALAEELRMRLEAGKATLFVGIAALGLGKEREAEKLLAEAAAIFESEGNAVSRAVCMIYQAELAARRGALDAATRELADAVQTFAGEGLRLNEATARVRLAYAELGRGNVGAAEREIARARRLLRSLPSSWLKAQLDHLRGRISERRGASHLARAAYRRAIERLEAVRGRIGLDEFRISFAENKAPIYADLIELTLARGGPRSVSEAFELVERSRSRALVDLLAGRLAASTAGDQQSVGLLKRLENLRGELSWLSGYEHEGGGARRNEQRMLELAPRIREREAEIADLMLRLQRRNAPLGALTVGETVSLPELQAALDPKTTLIEYYSSHGGTRAFVVRRDHVRVVTLPVTRQKVEEGLSRLRFQIEKWGYGNAYAESRGGVLREATDRHLRLLAEQLWDPLGVDTERVIIVPHGPLHSLPFHALRLADGEHLVDRSLVSYLPSASTLRFLGSHARSLESALVVGVETPSIPHVADEITGVRRAFRRGRSLKNGAATRARFMELAGGADVVHLATHGIFRQDDPYFSALRLADGWLSLYDIYGLRLRAALVCLSACQSGRSWVSGGDELIGLTRGFLHAGASNLVVSLWPVQDASTAEFMALFYGSLTAGARPEGALRAAMVELRERYPHPYHWAPFILTGAPVPTRAG